MLRWNFSDHCDGIRLDDGPPFYYAVFYNTVSHKNVIIALYQYWLRAFENRVLRRIFGPKSEGVIGEWRKLHDEELYDLYCSPNIILVIKSRMRWAEHVACMGRGETGFWLGNLKERDNL